MNPWDKDNLIFLLTADPKDYEAWLDQATLEEVSYALKLMDLHKTELQVEKMKWNESTENLDCTEALAVINRIKQSIN
jgi:hypothetical protein